MQNYNSNMNPFNINILGLLLAVVIISVTKRERPFF